MKLLQECIETNKNETSAFIRGLLTINAAHFNLNFRALKLILIHFQIDNKKINPCQFKMGPCLPHYVIWLILNKLYCSNIHWQFWCCSKQDLSFYKLTWTKWLYVKRAGVSPRRRIIIDLSLSIFINSPILKLIFKFTFWFRRGFWVLSFEEYNYMVDYKQLYFKITFRKTRSPFS